MPGTCVVGTTKPTELVVYKSPVAPVLTIAWSIVVDGVTPVFLQAVTTPLTYSVCSEFAAKPLPVITICAPGLTAVNSVSCGSTLNVAIAHAPDAPVTVTVCGPAAAEVGITYPSLINMAPFVLITLRPTCEGAVITVVSNVTIIVSPAANPEPVIAILTEPSLLVVGVIWICEAATLRVVDAELVPSDNDSV